MLDEETISELKVLENPKLSRYVNRALEEREFLDALIEQAEGEDWPLRWGVSTILVQVSKRKPALLKDTIPFFMGRILNEDKRMVRDNISQSLLHLSNFAPEDFVRHDAPRAFVQFLVNGEDHERYDAVKVMEYIVKSAPEFVTEHIHEIEHATQGIDNPVVKGEAERALKVIKTALSL